MSAHTPGPWTFTDYGPVPGEIDDCHIYIEAEKYSVAVIEKGSLPEHEAVDWRNARLIAAAPELLAALQAVDADSNFFDTEGGLQPISEHTLALVRAALAKTGVT